MITLLYMPDTSTVQQTNKTKPQLPPSGILPKCRVVLQPDGGMRVEFLIEPDAANRIRKRAYTMKLETFLWENMLKQAINSVAY